MTFEAVIQTWHIYHESARSVQSGKLLLIVWLSFIDDVLVTHNKSGMDQIKEMFTKVVDCVNIGPMQEYIGTNIDMDNNAKV